MKRIIIFVTLLMLSTMNLVGLIPDNTKSAELHHVVDDNEIVMENTVVIPDGGGEDIFLGNFTLRKGVPVSDAYFNLTGSANGNGEYPEEVQVNVWGKLKNDGDNQYEFRGSGYGAMGFQHKFATNFSSIQNTFSTGGSDDTIEVLLPKTAKVKTAEVGLTGGFFQVRDKIQIDTSQNNVVGVHPIDMDGDGDLDVVAAGNNEVVWHNNTNGIGTTWTEHKINSSQASVSAVYAFDVDNDNDTDVVAVSRGTTWPNWNGPVVYYRNMDGKGRTWNTHIVNASNKPIWNSYDISVADMDNDGDGDIIVSQRNWTGLSGPVYFNNTDGNGTKWTMYNIATSYIRNHGVIAMDVDDDGDNDTVVTNNWGRQVHWFENLDGKATSWSSARLIGQNTGTWAITYLLDKGDIDGDGDLDIAVACGDAVRWYQCPPTPTNTWTAYTVGSWDGTSSTFADVAIGDMGNPGAPPDGNLDIVGVSVASTTNEVQWFVNDGTPTQSNWEQHKINSPHGGAAFVALGDIDKKDYLDVVVGANPGSTNDDVVWFKLNGSFPTNVKLDIGADSSNEWSYSSGWFKTTEVASNLEDSFNSQINSLPVDFTDTFYNDFVRIKVKLTTDTGGWITMQDLKIEYDYTAKVKGDLGKSLAKEITEYTSGQGPGNDTIPIYVKTSTGGQLKISDITVIYNDYPKALKIDGYWLDEDTSNSTLVDLSKHFTDDLLNSTQLIYTVEQLSNDTKAELKIEPGSHYMGVFAEKDPSTNWNGFIEFKITASDNGGLITVSDKSMIEVRPVNDEPVTGSKKIPDIAISEGSKSFPIDLDGDSYFVDVDLDKLYYDTIVDPFDEQKNELLNASVNSTNNELIINAYGDWYTIPGNYVRVRILCDDDPDDINQSTAYQDIFVTVNNLDDDPPVWSPIDDVYMQEDEPLNDAFNLFSYVTDVDNPDEDMKFSIIHVSNSKVHVDIDGQSNIDISAEENFFGTATVDVRASDGTNVGKTSFNIIIENVNDKPEVRLNSPSNGATVYSDIVVLSWIGSDVDPGDTINLTYDIFLDTTGGTEPYQLDYSGTSINVTGLQDKGTYYWKVIPDDGTDNGMCVSVPCPASFTVDIGVLPHSVLKFPADDAVLRFEYITLSWEGFPDEEYTISYDVYLSNQSLKEPFPESALVKKATTNMNYLLGNLTPYETYYWTVIPSTIRGTGYCQSGVWTFMYDPASKPHEINIEVEELRYPKGSPVTVNVHFKNLGDNDDVITPYLDSGALGDLVTMEYSSKKRDIEKGKEIILVLSISADKIDVGTYDLIIYAESEFGQLNESLPVTLTIYEKTQESTSKMTQAMLFTVPIIIIIIILVTVFFVLRKKRIEEEKKRVEAELIKPMKPQTIEAMDVQYISGPGGPTMGPAAVGAPAQLPSVTLPYSYGTQPGAVGQAPGQYGGAQLSLPQLPPGQPGAQPEQPAPATSPYGPAPGEQTYAPGPAPFQYQSPVQPQPQTVPPEVPQQVPQQPQYQQPTQVPPAQPGAEPRISRAGTVPEQVPYVPKQKTEEPQEIKPGYPEQTSATQTPDAGQVPGIEPETPSEQTPHQLHSELKEKFINGSVSEETYIDLKKELRDHINSGGTSEQIDSSIKQFINGKISEDEYKRLRNL